MLSKVPEKAEASESQPRRISKRVTRDPAFHLILEMEEFFSPTISPKVTKAISVEDRTHFLDKVCMRRLHQLIIIGSLCGAFPWTWSSKKKRIEPWIPRVTRCWWVFWILFVIQTAFLTIYQFYSFFYNLSHYDHRTNREIFMGVISLSFYVYCLDYYIQMYWYKEEMREYINTLLFFNKKHVDKYVVNLDEYEDGGRLVLNVSMPSNCFQIVTSTLLFLMMPYQPWYLFSHIYPKPWYWLVPGVIHEFALIGQLVSTHMLISWLSVAHGNSVEFWLREIQLRIIFDDLDILSIYMSSD